MAVREISIKVPHVPSNTDINLSLRSEASSLFSSFPHIRCSSLVIQSKNKGCTLSSEQDVKGSQELYNGDTLQKQLFRRPSCEHSKADQ